MISEKGKTSAGDPMTPFGLQTTFKKIKNTKRATSLSKEQAVEDYAILVDALKEGFPGLYDYVSEEEFNDYVIILLCILPTLHEASCKRLQHRHHQPEIFF